jgi:predicted nucleic acid-binding protein
VFVLDSSALLAFLYGEPGHQRVAELLTTAGDRTVLRLHRIHVGEVYYLFYRKGGKTLAEEMLTDIRQLPIILEDRVSPALMREARRLKIQVCQRTITLALSYIENLEHRHLCGSRPLPFPAAAVLLLAQHSRTCALPVGTDSL